MRQLTVFLHRISAQERAAVAAELRETHPEQSEKATLNRVASILAGRAAADAAGSHLPISHEPSGKPYFADRPGVCVSISHTSDYIAVSAAKFRHGIDIELPTRNGRLADRVAERFFTPIEQAWLSRIESSDEWRNAYICIWTRKEAIIKATGGTLGQLANLETRPAEQPNGWTTTPDGQAWYLVTPPMSEGWPMLSVCSDDETQVEMTFSSKKVT